MIRLVLVRHGESDWNRENRFTGWTDVDLSETGVAEAKEAAGLLRQEGYAFDLCYTSYLRRAIRTLWIVQDLMDVMWLPVKKSWRLNERHYGALQGMNKAEMTALHGEEQVFKWRRGYAVRPPELPEDDHRHPKHDPRYAEVPPDELPAAESLKDTVARVLPYWYGEIAPTLLSGKRILIAAHGNSIRALVKYLDKISDEDIMGVNIPTGVPLIYELDEDLRPVRHYYLGDQEKIQAKIKAVAGQAKGSAAKTD